MSYVGFNLRNTTSVQRPKKRFRPVFEQLSSGEHPRVSKNTNPTVSWSKVREHLDAEEKQFNALSNKIYMTLLFVAMLAMIISQVA